MSKKEFLILFFLLAATFLSLSPSLWGEFTNWDDQLHVLENPSVLLLNPKAILAIFQSAVNEIYIPLTTLSFAVEHHFFGFNPFVYHLDNLLLHLAVTALIFLLGLRMGLKERGAAAAALLFGIHPMHVESVAWITERKDVLYSFFYMLALCGYWRYLETNSRSAYSLSLLSGLLSILAKPMALSLPLILCLLDRFHGRKLNQKFILDKIPFLVYIIPIAWITYSLHTRIPGENVYQAILMWIWSFSFYLRMFFFPIDPSPLYPPPLPVSLTNPTHMMSAAIFLFTGICLWLWRKNKWFTFAVGYYVLSIFFLLRFDVDDGHIVADRFMYLPSVGFCLLFGFLIQQGFIRLEKRRLKKYIAIACMAILFLGLSVQTFSQCKIWNNSVTVWSEMLKDIPGNWFALYGRAKAYELEKQYDLALADYAHALLDKPDLIWVYENRGTMLYHLGREDEALKDFDKAAILDPRSAEVFNNRSLIYSNRKNYQAALTDLDKAIELKPDYLTAYRNRGLVYAAVKEYERALEDFDRGLVLDPSNAELYYCRSLAYVTTNRLDAAIENAVKARDFGYPGMDGYIDSLNQQRSTPH